MNLLRIAAVVAFVALAGGEFRSALEATSVPMSIFWTFGSVASVFCAVAVAKEGC